MSMNWEGNSFKGDIDWSDYVIGDDIIEILREDQLITGSELEVGED